jgi:hypothetical protein
MKAEGIVILYTKVEELTLWCCWFHVGSGWVRVKVVMVVHAGRSALEFSWVCLELGIEDTRK